MSEEQGPLPAEELAAIERRYQRKLRAMRRRTLEALGQLSANEDGFARLLAISDEEWQAAMDAEGGSQE